MVWRRYVSPSDMCSLDTYLRQLHNSYCRFFSLQEKKKLLRFLFPLILYIITAVYIDCEVGILHYAIASMSLFTAIILVFVVHAYHTCRQVAAFLTFDLRKILNYSYIYKSFFVYKILVFDDGAHKSVG